MPPERPEQIDFAARLLEVIEGDGELTHGGELVAAIDLLDYLAVAGYRLVPDQEGISSRAYRKMVAGGAAAFLAPGEDGIDPFPEEGKLDVVVKKLVEENPGFLDDTASLMKAVDDLGTLRAMGALWHLWDTGRTVSSWNGEKHELEFQRAEET